MRFGIRPENGYQRLCAGFFERGCGSLQEGRSSEPGRLFVASKTAGSTCRQQYSADPHKHLGSIVHLPSLA
jgi:hypothetical protein